MSSESRSSKSTFNRAACIALLSIAAASLIGCGGGDSEKAATPGGTTPTQNTSISATPTASGQSGAVPLAMMFTATAPKGPIATYEWDFKDNTPMVTGATAQHTFMEPGAYEVTLTVRDAAGNFNRASLMVTAMAGAGASCAAAPALFTTKVWPSMSGNCTACHVTGGLAGGSALKFAAGGSELQNYNILRDYSNASSDTLLMKVVGGLMHGGGTPFGNTNDQRYKDLATLVTEMKAPCTAAPINPPVAGQFWNGVEFADNPKVLGNAAVLFAGRNPTAAETAAVIAGGVPVLRSTIRGYMTGPTFDRFLEETGDTHFLPAGVVAFGNNRGYNATDYPTAALLINGDATVPGADRTAFEQATRREPNELMKFIVKGDRPWTDMVAGNYTVVNGVVARYLNATVTGTFVNPADNTEFLPATIPSQRLGGMREHAGVLSTHAWLDRFPTTDTNRNRHRVYIMAKQFLGTNVAALAMRPIDDGGNFKIPTMENPACAACHDTIDPMTAGWQNWAPNNRFLPNLVGGKNIALPGTYRSNNYPKDANNLAYYRAGDNWFRDMKAPGYGATPMPGDVTGNNTALQWLGMQVAGDSRFAKGAVDFWYRALFNREALARPIDTTSPQYANQLSAYNAQFEEFTQIADRFKTNRGNGAFNVKDLLADLMMSNWARAERANGLNAGRMIELADVGSFAMLNPAALNRTLLGLVGSGYNGFNNQFAGAALNYGNFDGGLNRTERSKELTMMQTITIDRLVAERSCAIVQADFAKASATRLLFAGIALTDTPANATGQAAIQQNIKYLHKALWNEDVPVGDAEVQRTYKLFMDVWNDRATAPVRPTTCAYNNTNDPNYVGRSWAAVIAYMVGDQKFLFQ